MCRGCEQPLSRSERFCPPLLAADEREIGRATLADAVAVYRDKQSVERHRRRAESLLELVGSGAWDGDPRSLAAVV